MSAEEQKKIGESNEGKNAEDGNKAIGKKDFSQNGIKNVDHARKQQKLVEEARNNFIEFFKQRQISEDLTTRLLKNGLTAETIRLLKSLGFSPEDLENLRRLWQIQSNDTEENKSLRSVVSTPSSSDEHLSLDNLYLKRYISAPIKGALREIILRKPNDPVEFMGLWLLHFKVCEERERKRKECEMELITEQEKLKLKQKCETQFYYSNNNEDEGEEGEIEKSWTFSDENMIY